MHHKWNQRAKKKKQRIAHLDIILEILMFVFLRGESALETQSANRRRLSIKSCIYDKYLLGLKPTPSLCLVDRKRCVKSTRWRIA